MMDIDEEDFPYTAHDAVRNAIIMAADAIRKEEIAKAHNILYEGVKEACAIMIEEKK